MKKHFNKRKFDPRSKKDNNKRNDRSEKTEWNNGSRKGNDRRGGKKYGDNRERNQPKPWEKREGREKRGGYKYSKGNDDCRSRPQKPWGKRREESRYHRRKDYGKKREDNLKKAFDISKNNSTKPADADAPASAKYIRLNKYLSNSGICSRREADTLIAAGAVKVNGKVITQMGYQVAPGDKVQFGNDTVRKERTVYILLNKPKGYITTTDDERNRATVLDLVQGIEERIYPVGRLDRNTSGLLLLTNDGDLATKLMHPKHRVAKIYHVILDKPVKPDDFDRLKTGVELEDGFIKPDEIAYVDGAETKKEIGIEIHSGKNRVIRRMFEHLGYNVEKLDRVLYAGLTKKNLGRGKWRHLSEGEVRMLKKIR